MDLGESFGMVQSLMEEMKESEQESSGVQDSEKEDSSEGMQTLKETFDEGQNKETKIDTTMDFYSIMPDSVRQKLSDPAALSIMQMHIRMDQEKNIGLMKMQIDYDSKEEVERFYDALLEMQSLDNNSAMAMGSAQGDTKELFESMFSNYKMDLDNSIIRIPRTDPLEALAEEGLLEELKPKLDSIQYLPEDSFERQMLEMMIPGESKTVVHAPGKILFTSDPGAEIDGNTVTFKQNVMKTLTEGGEIPTSDIIIKYKK